MKSLDLNKINKLYFGYEDIARIRGISPASAKVTASRYVKNGLLLRLKRNIYILKQVWDSLGLQDQFQLANLGQSPSYISLTTALSYYEITTQIQQNFIESIVIRRSKSILLDGTTFQYSKIKANLYFGFRKEKVFFIASPEKAFLDAVYLMSYGRYSLDLSAINIERLDGDVIQSISSKYPIKTREKLSQHGYL